MKYLSCFSIIFLITIFLNAQDSDFVIENCQHWCSDTKCYHLHSKTLSTPNGKCTECSKELDNNCDFYCLACAKKLDICYSCGLELSDEPFKFFTGNVTQDKFDDVYLELGDKKNHVFNFDKLDEYLDKRVLIKGKEKHRMICLYERGSRGTARDVYIIPYKIFILESEKDDLQVALNIDNFIKDKKAEDLKNFKISVHESCPYKTKEHQHEPGSDEIYVITVSKETKDTTIYKLKNAIKCDGSTYNLIFDTDKEKYISQQFKWTEKGWEDDGKSIDKTKPPQVKWAKK